MPGSGENRLPEFPGRPAVIRQGDLWVLEGGREPHRLTSDGCNYSPALSPEGEFIAVSRAKSSQGLTGARNGRSSIWFWEAYVNMDIRIVFERISDTLILHAIGLHDILRKLYGGEAGLSTLGNVGRAFNVCGDGAGAHQRAERNTAGVHKHGPAQTAHIASLCINNLLNL
jgi:hypothetical protein